MKVRMLELPVLDLSYKLLDLNKKKPTIYSITFAEMRCNPDKKVEEIMSTFLSQDVEIVRQDRERVKISINKDVQAILDRRQLRTTLYQFTKGKNKLASFLLKIVKETEYALFKGKQKHKIKKLFNMLPNFITNFFHRAVTPAVFLSIKTSEGNLLKALDELESFVRDYDKNIIGTLYPIDIEELYDNTGINGRQFILSLGVHLNIIPEYERLNINCLSYKGPFFDLGRYAVYEAYEGEISKSTKYALPDISEDVIEKITVKISEQ